LVSEKLDQTYHLSAVLRKGISLDIATLNALIKTLIEDGSLAPLLQDIRFDTGVGAL
jgi:hypothetical protein